MEVLLTVHASNHSWLLLFNSRKIVIRTEDQEETQHLPQ